MPLPDPSFLPPLAVVRETRSFEHPAYRGLDGAPARWSFTFEAQEGFPHALLVADLSARFFEEYVAGGKTVACGNGQIIPVDKTLCESIALLMAMDKTVPEPPEEGKPAELKYDFAKWAVLAERAELIFRAVHAFASELRAKAYAKSPNPDSGDVELGNGSAATEANTSEPPQDKDTVTPS